MIVYCSKDGRVTVERFMVLVEHQKDDSEDELPAKINGALSESGIMASAYAASVQYTEESPGSICPAWSIWFNADLLITECTNVDTFNELKTQRRKQVVNVLQQMGKKVYDSQRL